MPAQSSVPVVPDFETPRGMARLGFPAMGTRVTVLTPQADLRVVEPVVRDLFEEWEASLSRFRADSELSYINQRPGQPTIVTKLFARVLTAALAAARATNGVYDPTMLHQLVRAGYDRTFSDLPATREAPRTQAVPGGGWRAIRFDPGWRTVTMPEGIALDFGGIGKGMAVDAAIAALKALHVPHFAIEAGGDLRVHGTPLDRSGWPVAVETPAGSTTVTLSQGALATSSVARRRWNMGGRVQHHILDPRSGEPAVSGLWSVTAIAAECVQAEVAAKVAFIMGEVRGSQFLSRHDLPGLLVMPNGSQRRVGPWDERRSDNAT